MGDDKEMVLKRTRMAFLWTRILSTPFWALFGMLQFIAYKDLHATPLQMAMIITIKPLVSIFSTYWSALINKRQDRLLSNVMGALILGYFPFFFFPFIENSWFFVFAAGMYMTFAQRGVIPAWMEILKLNLPKEDRGKVFAYTSASGYLGDAVMPFILGWLLDDYFQAWRWIFPIAALISLSAIFLQGRIPIHLKRLPAKCSPHSFYEQLILPWKSAWDLLCRRPDFAKFQIGFMMLGGGGLMFMQPALTGYFIDVLNLSYTELAIALTCCKGLGVALTSSTWANWMNKIDIYRLSSWVTSFACVFVLFLIAAQTNVVWLYNAYFCYGVMQAGSELSWNMSGPIFAKEEESPSYSSLNILTVGLRGAIIPPLGSLICTYSNSMVAIVLGGVLCFLATLSLASYSRRQAYQELSP